MAKYAATTKVSPDKSRGEIESIFKRYGATGFAYGWQADRAVIQFEMNRRHIRFDLPMPDRASRGFTHYKTRGGWMQERAEKQAEAQYEQAVRQRWRALVLSIKSKLEAVESNIEVFEEAFMAQIVLPDGKTVGQHMLPQIESSYQTGDMPPLLPAPGDVK